MSPGGFLTLKNICISKEILIPATFITPSCGTGTLTIPQAEKALNLTKEIALMAKDKWAEYL